MHGPSRTIFQGTPNLQTVHDRFLKDGALSVGTLNRTQHRSGGLRFPSRNFEQRKAPIPRKENPRRNPKSYTASPAETLNRTQHRQAELKPFSPFSKTHVASPTEAGRFRSTLYTAHSKAKQKKNVPITILSRTQRLRKEQASLGRQFTPDRKAEFKVSSFDSNPLTATLIGAYGLELRPKTTHRLLRNVA